MEQAAEQPEQYVLPDDFKGGVNAQRDKMLMYGRERFKYTTNSKDIERIQVSKWLYRRYETKLIFWLFRLLKILTVFMTHNRWTILRSAPGIW